MAPTLIGVGDPKAAIRWSALLSKDVNHAGFFSSKFTGKGKSYCIEEKTELEGESGDTISFDLLVQLVGEPVFGDERVRGTEENMRHRTDRIQIDQVRHPVSAGGKMTRQRTVHNLRKDAKTLLKDYFAKFKDEVAFSYLSGSRGINEDFIMRVGWGGFAQNAFRAPDAEHVMYGGAANSKATITAADTMSRDLVERAETKTRMLRATNRELANMQPLMINGSAHYVMVMSPFQEHDMRKDVGESGWLTIQRDAASAEGRNNPVFKGGLGMVKNVVLQSHENVIRFNDFGAGSNVAAARSLFLGAQAGVCAHGTSDKRKYNWHEELVDAGNEMVLTAGMIYGMQKSRFNGHDFGVISIDTASADPNA